LTTKSLLQKSRIKLNCILEIGEAKILHTALSFKVHMPTPLTWL